MWRCCTNDHVDFYLQLYAIEHGVNPEIAFYTVRTLSLDLRSRALTHRHRLQLAVMNAAAVFGRVVPNYFADKYGPFNTVLPVTFACAVLLFALFGITTLAGTVVFAILFGFFSGACQSPSIDPLPLITKRCFEHRRFVALCAMRSKPCTQSE